MPIERRKQPNANRRTSNRIENHVLTSISTIDDRRRPSSSPPRTGIRGPPRAKVVVRVAGEVSRVNQQRRRGRVRMGQESSRNVAEGRSWTGHDGRTEVTLFHDPLVGLDQYALDPGLPGGERRKRRPANWQGEVDLNDRLFPIAGCQPRALIDRNIGDFRSARRCEKRNASDQREYCHSSKTHPADLSYKRFKRMIDSAD